VSLKINRVAKGKVLHNGFSGASYFASRHKLFVYEPEKGVRSDKPYAILKLPVSGWKQKIAGFSRLLSRLFRFEIRAVYEMRDGNLLVCNQANMYHFNSQTNTLSQVNFPANSRRTEFPINISGNEDDSLIVWGEYWNNKERQEVHIYGSEDFGKNFQVLHTFPAGEIRHIHNLVYDKWEKVFWVLAGDHNHEPGIAIYDPASNDFKWVHKGEQRYRAVHAFVFEDQLIYATDTEMEDNAIYSLSKKDHSLTKLASTNGSCIHGTQCKDYLVFGTSVEPLKNEDISTDRCGSIWISKNTKQWHCIKAYPKDRWDERYFQFGSLMLPNGYRLDNQLFFSGQALKSIDNRILHINLDLLDL